MEKVSEADLVKRVKAFILNDNYAGALAVVKGVDAGRIKNPPVLCLIGEVYMHEKQYEVAEEVFLRAYDRSPKNRKVLDLITSLYIEMGEYAEAEYYYKEFISVASRDLHRYILRYRLDKGKGERLSVLIDTLERLKDYEYIEEWAYELATLYEAAGEEKKCIHECDEIVLWFGHGEYVDKAIALKCKLTGESMPRMTTVEMQLAGDVQAEAAQRAREEAREAEIARRSRFDGTSPKPAVTEFSEVVDVHVINPDNALESAGVDTGIDTDLISKAMETQTAQIRAQDQRAMSNTGFLFGAMKASTDSFRNLREDNLDDEDDDEDDDDFIDEVIPEAPGAVEELFGADALMQGETEAAQTTPVTPETPEMSQMPQAAATTGKSQRLQAVATPETPQRSQATATSEISQRPQSAATPETPQMPKAAAIPETAQTPQAAATPGMSQRPKLAATPEAAQKPALFAAIQELADDETLKLVQEHKNADRPKMPEFLLKNDEDMDFHTSDDDLAQLEALIGDVDSDLPQAAEVRETVAGMQAAVSQVANGGDTSGQVMAETDEVMDDSLATEALPESEEPGADGMVMGAKIVPDTVSDTTPGVDITQEPDHTVAATDDVYAAVSASSDALADAAVSRRGGISAPDEDDGIEMTEALEGMTEDQDEVILEQAVFGGLPTTNMYEADLDDDDDDEILDEEDAEDIISDEDEAFLAGLFSTGEDDVDKDEVMEENIPIPQTVKDIFATVPDVKNVHQQLAMTFTKFEASGADYDVLAPYDINFVVLSDDSGVKSQIAIGIAKALNTYGICDKNKIVRAKASELNCQDFSVIFPKIAGGCLIIEGADELSDASVAIIEKEVGRDNQDVAIVLESRQDALKAFWKKHRTLRGRFLNVINVSKYNEAELVTLAKSYIEKRGYELSPEAALVLKNYFSRHLLNNDVVGYEDVMNVVDGGIENLDKRNMKNLFMTVLDNKYEEAHMLRLLPEDFKNLQ